MEADNGTREACSINYATGVCWYDSNQCRLFLFLSLELQPASLGYFSVAVDRIRVGITRPIGSFDYVLFRCVNNESFELFNSALSTSDAVANVECSFLLDVPLMSLVLETHKIGFNPALISVARESKDRKKSCQNRPRPSLPDVF